MAANCQLGAILLVSSCRLRYTRFLRPERGDRMEDHGPRKAGNLRRTLTFTTATAIVIGSVIGSGIFKKTAPMMDSLPSAVLVLGVWVLAGAVTFLGGLCAAELAACWPESGGLYAHLRRSTGRFVSFLYGWSVLSVIQTGSIAAIAYIFAQYLGYFGDWGDVSPELSGQGWIAFGILDLDPFKELYTKLVAVACIWIVTAMNVVGVRLGAAVQNLFTGLKILVIVALVVVAATGTGSLSHLAENPVLPSGMDAFGLAGAVVAALSAAFWAYDGWINVTYVAAEVKNPVRNLPRSLALGLGIVTVSYLAVNVAYFYLLSPEEIRGSSLVAALAIEKVLPLGAALASAAVVISTFGTVNGTTMSSARVYFAMARDGLLPRAIGDVHPGLNTPHVALLVQGVWASLLVFSGTFDQITDMLIFVSWAFYGLLAVAVVVARIRFPGLERPFRVPGYPVIPLVFAAFSAAYVVFSVLENTRNALFGTVLVAVGLPVWAWYWWRSRVIDPRQAPGA
jgi:APA family basic amino acid/polyamine antiporter